MANNINILSTALIEPSWSEESIKAGIGIDFVAFLQINSLIDDAIRHKISELFNKQSAFYVFTSSNAVEIIAGTIDVDKISIPVFCLGGGTKAKVEQYFKNATVIGTGNSALELAKAIIKNKIKKVVFFSGNLRRDVMIDVLRESGVHVEEIVVYETVEVPKKVDKNYNGILFYSPSGVHCFFKLNTIQEDTVLFAIGNTTGDALKEISKNKVVVSNTPSKKQVLDLAVSYFS